MKEYIVVGDTEKYDACLVKICRGMNKEQAEKVLERMLNNPDKHDKKLMEGHTNFRLILTEEKDQWWNDPFLMSD